MRRVPTTTAYRRGRTKPGVTRHRATLDAVTHGVDLARTRESSGNIRYQKVTVSGAHSLIGTLLTVRCSPRETRHVTLSTLPVMARSRITVHTAESRARAYLQRERWARRVLRTRPGQWLPDDVLAVARRAGRRAAVVASVAAARRAWQYARRDVVVPAYVWQSPLDRVTHGPVAYDPSPVRTGRIVAYPGRRS